jgi:hypothetical protein
LEGLPGGFLVNGESLALTRSFCSSPSIHGCLDEMSDSVGDQDSTIFTANSDEEDTLMHSGTQEDLFLVNSSPSPTHSVQRENSPDLEYIQSSSTSSPRAIQNPLFISESPPPQIEAISDMRYTQAGPHLVNQVIDFVTCLGDSSLSFRNKFPEEGKMMADQSAKDSQVVSRFADSSLAYPVQATLSVASNALVEMVFHHLNHVALYGAKSRPSNSLVDQIIDQFFDTSTTPATPRPDLYLALHQKSAPQLQEIFSQLSPENSQETSSNLNSSQVRLAIIIC